MAIWRIATKGRAFRVLCGFALGLVCVLFALPAQAASAQDGVAAFLSEASGGDLASLWLSFLFSGDTSLPEGGADTLTSLTIALRQALRIYGLSMFVLGGFFLMAQLVSMVAETAQTGVLMGRRANQLWAPIRLLIGISLLVPFTSGLSLGQHFVVKIASNGSVLASEAWQGIVENIGEDIFQPLAPHLPDVGRVVSTAAEMELCRSMYQFTIAAAASSPVATAAGDMTSLTKLSAGRLAEETWLYTNDFFPDVGLCGGYSFIASAPSQKEPDSSQDAAYVVFVAAAARASAERLSNQMQPLANASASSFLALQNGKATPVDIKESLATFVAEQTQLIEGKQAQILQQWKQTHTTNLVASSESQGWLSAGAFPFTLSRQQMALGDLSERALPKVKAPLLGHAVLTREDWEQAARDHLQMALAPSTQFESYNAVYHYVTDGMKRARAWLYDRQVAHVLAVLPDQQDVRDALGPYADAESAQTTLSRLVTTGAASFGVFARSPQDGTLIAKSSSRQSSGSSVLPERAFVAQPLQTLAEMGRRYMGYGSWLLGMLSPAFAEPATFGMALSFGVIAFLFWAAGACLLFAVPFIPFFRFLIAALGWGVAVLGAVLSLPLVALAHLYPVGDGLAGPVARQAYWLWLSLFLRPVLILMGFVGGLLFFFLGVALLNSLMLVWGAPTLLPQSQAFWLLRAGLALLYALAVLILAHVSFRGIALFPSLLQDWINTRGALPDTTGLAQVGAGATGAQGNGQPLSLLSVMERGSTTTAEALSNLSQSLKSKSTKQTLPTTQEVARRQAQAAQFPHLPELKAAQRVQARAEAHAFAKAEGVGPEGGRHESIAAASASAHPDEVKAMAISRHMVPDERVEKSAGPAARANLLSADDPKAKKASDTPETKTNESPEQESVGLDPENNPFKPSPPKDA